MGGGGGKAIRQVTGHRLRWHPAFYPAFATHLLRYLPWGELPVQAPAKREEHFYHTVSFITHHRYTRIDVKYISGIWDW